MKKKDLESKYVNFDVLLKLAIGDYSTLIEVFNVSQELIWECAIEVAKRWSVNLEVYSIEETLSEMKLQYIISLDNCGVLKAIRSKI